MNFIYESPKVQLFRGGERGWLLPWQTVRETRCFIVAPWVHISRQCHCASAQRLRRVGGHTWLGAGCKEPLSAGLWLLVWTGSFSELTRLDGTHRLTQGCAPSPLLRLHAASTSGTGILLAIDRMNTSRSRPALQISYLSLIYSIKIQLLQGSLITGI